jgi:hypothetical protein
MILINPFWSGCNFFCNAGGTLLMAVWLFSGMILAESYGGILRASLLAEEFEKPMETFQGKWPKGMAT